MQTFWMVLVPIVAVIFFALVIRWALRWHDPNFSSKDKQAQAELWSKRRGGERR